MIGNDTEVKSLVLNGSRIVNSNEGWFLIVPNSLGTIILPNNGQSLKNLPQGTIIVPNNVQVIKNFPQGAIIVLREVINNLPQGAIILPNKDFVPFLNFDGKDFFLKFDGKNFIDAEHVSQLQLQNFTLSVWFKTNKTDYIQPGHIINKGGFNIDEEGRNMNYGIWMTNGSILGGYETKLGKHISVKSPNTYNDGKWHFAILINNGSTLRLDIDKETVDTKSTNGAIPDYIGEQPFRIGANSLQEDKFFYGNIGEVNVWNRPLTDMEINKIYNNDNYSLKGLVLYLKTGSTYSLIPPPGQTSTETLSPDSDVLGESNETDFLQPGSNVTSRSGELDIHSPDTLISPSESKAGHQMTTTKPTAKEFNIAISSDWGCTSDSKETVKNLQDKNPELVIAGGDLSYDDATGTCWIEEIIKPVETKTKIAFGDHDYVGKGEDRKPKQEYLAHFNLPKTYYSFNKNNVHFLIMDPNIEHGKNSNQFKFVQDDLKSASLNQSINWIFVVEHVPLYTSPSEHPGESTIRDIYHPLFDKYGVDLVINGDNHNYQRTFPLKYNGQNPTVPLITNTNKTYYDDLNGQIYLITGVGGRSLYNITD